MSPGKAQTTVLGDTADGRHAKAATSMSGWRDLPDCGDSSRARGEWFRRGNRKPQTDEQMGHGGKTRACLVFY
jgi:hypothetical protein